MEELLQNIYQISSMGLNSTNDLLKSLKGKDNKIIPLVMEISKNYEKYVKESKKTLKKNKFEIKDISLIAKTMSKVNISKEIMSDNSDSNIANMLIQGITMGNLELEKNIKKYEKEDKKIIDLAKKLQDFGEEYIKKLENYL